MRSYKVPLIIQSALIIILSINYFLSSRNYGRAIETVKLRERQFDTCYKNSIQISKNFDVMSKNAEEAINLTHKLSDKIKAYEDAYGIILMPGESMTFQIPIEFK